ncbi:hypothetical protein D3C85_1280310 [compost metagenome]
MAQQVHHQHLALGRPGLEALHIAARVDAKVLPRRDVLADRIVESDLAFLDQHHDRHRGDRLRHRVDAEDRILGQRRLPLAVGHAQHRIQHDFAAPPHLDQRAGQLAACHVGGIEKLLDPLQPGPGHALHRLVLHRRISWLFLSR